MMGALKTIIGLVFDDWYLGIGTIVAIVLTKVLMVSGVTPTFGGAVLLIVILLSLSVSLMVEYNKKKKKA